MGWWSGNRDEVNRRARKRFEEAKDLVSQTEDLAGERRDLKREFLTRGHQQMMARNLKGLMDTRQAIRRQEESAMERVAAVTGNNPLAALRARQDFMSDDELREVYGSYADERIDILGAKTAGELDIQSGYLQDIAQSKGEMASLMMQFREEVDPGMGGSVMGMAGSIIGGFICWVAREVYGQGNPKWVLFRSWLLEDAPLWFVKLYMKHGERFAEFISNKPWLKAIIRQWMDKKIAGRMIKVTS